MERQRRYNPEGKARVEFYVDEGLWERFKAHAEANHRTAAGELRVLLEQHVGANVVPIRGDAA